MVYVSYLKHLVEYDMSCTSRKSTYTSLIWHQLQCQPMVCL